MFCYQFAELFNIDEAFPKENLENEKLQVNLQEMVEKYIWKLYKRDVGYPKRLLLLKRNFWFDVKWSYVDFKHETVETNVRDVKTSDGVHMFTSEYENRTGKDQVYEFSISRETTNTTTVEVQDTYTLGASMELGVDIGGVKIGVVLNSEMSTTNTVAHETSKTNATNINTPISVNNGEVAIATLATNNKTSVIDFTVHTTMSLLPSKRCLPVTIRKRCDNTVVNSYVITNVECLFSDKFTTGNPSKVKLETRPVPLTSAQEEKLASLPEHVRKNVRQEAEVVAIMTSRGVCRRSVWETQRVKVESKPIDEGWC